MQPPISIVSYASLTPLGDNPTEVWKAYLNAKSNFSVQSFSKIPTVVAALQNKSNLSLNKLKENSTHYKNLDRSVLMGIHVSKNAFLSSGWKVGGEFGINMGSSRGATELFEQYHSQFVETGKVATLSSPTTTLGNISTWIAHELQNKGPVISHSITCSTALHSFLNGVAWIQSGFTDKFLVGGTEAPLTPFTVAQMKALKIYTSQIEADYPCLTLDFTKKTNQMFLGEGAAAFCLEKGVVPQAKAFITGIGYSTEVLKHNISISTEADCFQKSMQMAIGDTPLSEIDAIVMHAPGTIKGDLSEYNAIKKVFLTELPLLTSNKWKIGHSFGASGALSMELALLMLAHQKFIGIPFLKEIEQDKAIKTVLVNAVGFGGNAVTIKLESSPCY